MTMPDAVEPDRAALDETPGPVVLEFGTPWCGYCKAAQLLITDALQDAASIRHVRIEDGKGRRLGRSYRVKLWPTLIFLKDGEELARCVRPESAEDIKTALARIV